MGCALLVMAALTACGPDLHLSTSNLEIAPNPAAPGDSVVASFLLSLIPPQKYTIIVRIDEQEYSRVTDTGAPPIPVILQLGDAADLIAEYGTGTHLMLIVVSADESNETTRTRSIEFELRDTTSTGDVQ